jgi:hypothetical protein
MSMRPSIIEQASSKENTMDENPMVCLSAYSLPDTKAQAIQKNKSITDIFYFCV